MQAALLRPREKNLSNRLSRSDLNIHPSKNLQLCMNVGLLWKLSKEEQCFILKAFQHWNQTFWQVFAFENTPYSDPNLDGWATVNVCWHLINYVNACDLLQIVFRLDQEWWSGFLVATQIGLIFIFFISHCPLKLCTKLWYFEMKKKCWRNNKERWGMFNNTCNYQHQ